MSLVVHFETHSTTTDNESGIATGWLPGELSSTGKLQALGVADRVASRNPVAILSSDLGRAWETVNIVLDEVSYPVFYDWRLRECNYGELNGASRSDVLGPIGQYLFEPYPGGESWDEAVGRAERGIHDIARQWAGETVVIIGHVATRWALERLSFGRTLEEIAGEEFVWQPGWSYIVSG